MPSTPLDLSGAKILLVDDTPANLKLLRQALEPEGYSILVATNGEAALKVAATAQPDLILLDVQMPGINGFETCRRLKADSAMADTPVIFVTARTETESVVEGFHAGGIDYITKPFNNEEVLIRVQTHLKVSRLTHSLDESNTALSEANRRIQASAERKLQFFASMSHELRTPLTSIKGYVDNMRDGVTGDLTDRQERTLDRVGVNVDHLMGLINDILDISRLEAGRLEVHPEPFDLEDLVASCCAAIGPLIKPDVALESNVAEDVGHACTDSARLRQIILNLMGNAAKFTEAGEISVKLWKEQSPTEDPTLAVAVSDTGIGIPEDAREAIFEEFRQVEGTEQTHKGSGLGLAIT
ncbi:MAG: hybrid sensor histidine kinase/response regulator, partial [Candidatus Latescibacteria bacterium]|nr:hybrid sensor histidine kinase/response regulator [Candidatus Latescibacterota bacterium]